MKTKTPKPRPLKLPGYTKFTISGRFRKTQVALAKVEGIPLFYSEEIPKMIAWLKAFKKWADSEAKK